MNGFYLQLFTERDRLAGYATPGWHIAYGIDHVPTMYPADKAEKTMREIADMIGNRSQELQGFTLFLTDRGWQMSVRRMGESGWDMKIIEKEQADAVLSMLKTSGHPDAPMVVQTDTQPTRPSPVVRPLSGQDDHARLLALMEAAAGAREALTHALAR